MVYFLADFGLFYLTAYIRIDDVVFCSYFVCLSENDEVKTINSAVALKLAEGSNQSIVGYYL